jgi:hypothetical protein
MKPIGLTMKKSRNKYQLSPRGELMLVHLCIDCETISINRIAADDDPEMILTVFQFSLQNGHFKLYSQHDIDLLGEKDMQSVQSQLYGQSVEMYT